MFDEIDKQMIAPSRQRIKLKRSLQVAGMLFILTGCAGLLAEQCFEKLLTGLVGASTPAAAIVLSVYFLGLTAGSLAYGRVFSAGGNPMRIFACLECGIALWSVLLCLTAAPGILWLTPLLKLGAGHFWSLQMMRFIVACIWILPPTMLMGASFPAIVSVLERLRVPEPRRAISRFYALNLLGAIAGAALGPYLVFPHWGLSGTLLWTAVVDGVVAVSALILAVRIHDHKSHPAESAAEASSCVAGRSRISLLLALAFFTGFIFFGLEIVWTHLIGAVLGNSIYAFSAMLTLVLLGLGVGGGLSTRVFSEKHPVSSGMVCGLLFGGSLLLAWQFPIWPKVPNQFILWGSGMTRFPQGELLRWLQAGRLLLPPTILFGMVYPALFRTEFFPLRLRALNTARLVALNSIGCASGALVTGFFLIPAIGSEATLILFGDIAVFAGISLALLKCRGLQRGALTAFGLILLMLWSHLPGWNRLDLTSGGHVNFREMFVGPKTRLLFFHEDTLGGITTVVANSVQTGEQRASGQAPPVATGVRTLLTNGKFQANDGSEVLAQTGFALAPILHTARFDDALVIGMGSGYSATVVNQMGFKRIDIAEIAPGIVMAADSYFNHVNDNLLHHSNIKLHMEDGRNHLLLTDRSYDLITMEISSIWYAGSTSLYSREFYELARSRLRPGGIMQQWIQIHHISMSEIGSVIATMRRVFPFVSFWVVGGQGILVSGNEPLQLQTSAIQSLFTHNPWRDSSQQEIGAHLFSLIGSRLLSSGDVDRMLASATFRINTDANRYLEYASPKYNLSREPYEINNVRWMAQYASFPPSETTPGIPPAVASILQQVTPEVQRKYFILK